MLMKIITLRVRYCFMKPPATVVARKNRLKLYLPRYAYLNIKEQNANVMLPAS